MARDLGGYIRSLAIVCIFWSQVLAATFSFIRFHPVSLRSSENGSSKRVIFMTMGTDCFVLKLDFVTFLDEFKCLKMVLSFKSLNAKHLQQLKKK